MVVDDIHDDAKAAPVAGVDEGLEPLGSAVGRLRREEVHPVVAPAAAAGKLMRRHELDVRHAQPHEMVEALDRGGVRALGRERADVDLVEDGGGERGRLETRVAPRERRVVDDARGAEDPVRLPR